MGYRLKEIVGKINPPGSVALEGNHLNCKTNSNRIKVAITKEGIDTSAVVTTEITLSGHFPRLGAHCTQHNPLTISDQRSHEANLCRVIKNPPLISCATVFLPSPWIGQSPGGTNIPKIIHKLLWHRHYQIHTFSQGSNRFITLASPSWKGLAGNGVHRKKK